MNMVLRKESFSKVGLSDGEPWQEKLCVLRSAISEGLSHMCVRIFFLLLLSSWVWSKSYTVWPVICLRSLWNNSPMTQCWMKELSLDWLEREGEHSSKTPTWLKMSSKILYSKMAKIRREKKKIEVTPLRIKCMKIGIILISYIR